MGKERNTSVPSRCTVPTPDNDNLPCVVLPLHWLIKEHIFAEYG